MDVVVGVFYLMVGQIIVMINNHLRGELLSCNEARLGSGKN